MVDRIGTEGLNQLARDARRAGADLPKALARINKRFVNERFVPTARRNAAGRANPRAGHKVVNTIRGLGNVGYILEQAIDENMPGAVDAYGDMVLALMARREVS
jgi:hypothetical protein